MGAGRLPQPALAIVAARPGVAGLIGTDPRKQAEQIVSGGLEVASKASYGGRRGWTRAVGRRKRIRE